MASSSRPRPLIAGNWKMNRTPAESAVLIRKLLPLVTPSLSGCDVALAPPFTSLPAAAAELRGSGVDLGAQDVHWEDEGPYTGEVSPVALLEIGCRYVIAGHSERREHFGETDRRVNRKVRAVLFRGMVPIICIGEKQAEREAGLEREVVLAQLQRALEGIRLLEDQTLAIAYEPVWAIGTGLTATPAQASEIHRLIRQELVQTYGAERGEGIRILYGGSVTKSNAAALLAAPEIDGALVGGASLKAEDFASICATAAATRR